MDTDLDRSQHSEPIPPYQDVTLSIEARVGDLVSRMTLEEKVSQMMSAAPAIERLGIPKYVWWNECLHGVARAGVATVFPQAIGLASTWNTGLIHRVATAIGDEARAKHHDSVRHGIRERYAGLTFWSPNINIFRDPRWGRGQETYGEDPYLTARMGVAFVRGLQGEDPRYLKVVATPKHFAVHSGPEDDRHHFDARVDERDLKETYLPAFRACVQEGKAASIMGAYNRTNGEPCCASGTLLESILRRDWGFDGYIVSDCGAISDIYRHHRVVESATAAAVTAVKAGCDMECSVGEDVYRTLVQAVEDGLISEEHINQAVQRLFTARFRLGMFDPPEMVAYAQIPYEVNDSPAHRELALQAARESIVLLKNANGFLPLSKDLRLIAVIGPNADVVKVLNGNYSGTPSKAVTPLEGIRDKVSPGKVLHSVGCTISGSSSAVFEEAVELAQRSDVAVLVVGLSQALEGEEGQKEGVEAGGRSKGDRTDLNLPRVQEELLKAVHATGTPIVVVLINGSPLAINWANEHAAAIVEAWYPGEEGGTAIADVLFGDYSPAGRLPVTFPRSVKQLPPFNDYRMAGRTYRYMIEEPLFPFGYGLSYTEFEYSKLQISPREANRADDVEISAMVTNVGHRAGDEVVQLYVSLPGTSAPAPIRQLQGFERIHLTPGETETVTFTLTPSQFSLCDADGVRVVEAGEVRVTVGGCQPGDGQLIDSIGKALTGWFAIVGAATRGT
jgi:beta-glucosidase